MDIALLTDEQIMRLPDHCFGEKQLLGMYLYNNAPGTSVFGILDVVLPDPAVIWSMAVTMMQENVDSALGRAALRDTVPINQAQMDACQEIYPNWGIPDAGPNWFPRLPRVFTHVEISCRIFIVTGGKKIVMENALDTGKGRIQITMVVSGIPTRVPDWMVSI